MGGKEEFRQLLQEVCESEQNGMETGVWGKVIETSERQAYLKGLFKREKINVQGHINYWQHKAH